MSLLTAPQRGRAVPGPMRAGPGAPPPFALSPPERDNLGAQRRSKRLARGAAHNWTRRKVHPIVGIAPYFHGRTSAGESSFADHRSCGDGAKYPRRKRFARLAGQRGPVERCSRFSMLIQK